MADVGFWGAKKVHFDSFSPGGDPLSAFAVKGFIEAKGIHATMNIYGLCASAATIIAMACKHVYMASDAMWLPHRSSLVKGGTDDNTKAIDENIISAYEAKTGLSRERLAEIMDKDTLISAEEALEYGFVDEIIEPLAVAARKWKAAELSTTNMSEEVKKS